MTVENIFLNNYYEGSMLIIMTASSMYETI